MISHEVTVKSNVFVALSLAPVAVVVFSGRALADKIDKQYRHAAEIFRKGDLQGAAREFEEILRRKPGYEAARVLLGATHFMLGQEAERKGDQVGAAAELGEALRLEPDEAYWHSALAAVLNKRGDGQGAAKECAQAAELSPDDSGLAAGCGLRAGTEAEKKADDNPQDKAEGVRVFEPGGDVSPPVPTVHTAPPYSEKARMVRHQGAVVLRIVVNAQGEVEQASVVKSLGLGLDQAALRTVRTWKFRPATRNGVPVPVRVMVEISFRLF
jgi:TonB family protein